jgi:hypothetical protein
MVTNPMATPTIDLAAGVRPNLMEVAPFYDALKDANWRHTRIVHAGQQYGGGKPTQTAASLEPAPLPEATVR